MLIQLHIYVFFFFIISQIMNSAYICDTYWALYCSCISCLHIYIIFFLLLFLTVFNLCCLCCELLCMYNGLTDRCILMLTGITKVETSKQSSHSEFSEFCGLLKPSRGFLNSRYRTLRLFWLIFGILFYQILTVLHLVCFLYRRFLTVWSLL